MASLDDVPISEPPAQAREALVVDDEADVRRTAERILRRLGYVVTCAASGREAIAQVRAAPDRFALVITDLTMAAMDGVEVASAIRELAPRLPVVVMTGNGEPSDLRGVFAGALAKPFTVGGLAELLDRLAR